MYAEYGSKVGYNTYNCMRKEKAICGIIQDPLKAVYGGKEEGGCGGACCRDLFFNNPKCQRLLHTKS